MKLIIDNQKIEVEEKKTILEVAREKGIFIPSLCDHPRLTPFGGCRLCLVEIKGRRGFSPSCSTIVEDGMEVLTQTTELKYLRRQILELILSEHPHACLICSEKEKCDEHKGTIRKVGEVTGCVLCSNNCRCQLQEVVEALKIDRVGFPALYRNFEVQKDDPFFDRNYNLCILCGRCVRVCHEVRGASVLSFVFRGSQSAVGTVLDRTLLESGCQFCGACVDVCPTGALVERAIRPETVPDTKLETICPLCSIGCELTVELKDGKIRSTFPSEKGTVNQGQACLKGRFTIRDLVYSPRRVLKPLIRLDKELKEVSWEEALCFVAQKMKRYKGKEIAFVASAQASSEENFLFQKFAREGLNSENIGISPRFSPLASYWDAVQGNGLKPNLNFEIKDIAKARTIIVIGADVAISEPIVWLEIFQAIKKGAKLIIVNPKEISINRFSWRWLKIKPGTDFYLFGFLSKFLLQSKKTKNLSQIEGFESFRNSLNKLSLSEVFEMTGIKEEDLEKVAGVLLGEKPAIFLFGQGLTQHPWGRENVGALWNLALQTQAKLIPIGQENNSRGAFAIWSNSSRNGVTFDQIIQSIREGGLKALFLAGPASDLDGSKLEFLVIQDCFMNENAKFADAVLPATTFAEAEGTFANLEGRVQKFEKVIDALGEAKPDWWIISQLAQKMGLKGFSYKSPLEIMEEMNRVIPGFSGVSYSNLKKRNAIFIQEEKKKSKKFILLEYQYSPVKASKVDPFPLIPNNALDNYRSLDLSKEIKGLRIIRNLRRMRINAEDAQNLKLREEEKTKRGK